MGGGSAERIHRLGLRHGVSLVATSLFFAATGVILGWQARLLRQAEADIADRRVRDDMARVLHDAVLQTLALVDRRTSDRDPDLARTAREADRVLRRFLFGSTSRAGDTLEQRVRSAVERAARHHDATAHVPISVSVIDTAPPPPIEVADAVAAAIGEAVANALEHAEASRIVVFVESDDDGDVFASVRDDGCGFDVDQDRAGHGVDESIVARIRDIGGRTEVVSAPGTGTEVRVWSNEQPTSDEPAPAIRVVLADDHELMRSGLRGELGDRFDVVGEAESAINVITTRQPDLVVSDLHMPRGGGLAVVEACATMCPIVILTVSEAEGDLLDAVAAGAAGYLVKSAPIDEIRSSLIAAAAGEPVFSPSLAALVLGEFRRLARAADTNPLSERERQVLQLVARGHTYKEIGAELDISPKTVENHVRNILGKLHLSRRSDLIRYAVEHGLD